MADLAGAGWDVAKKLGHVDSPSFPRLTPQVDRLTDELAGKPVENGIGRAAFEGVVMAPLSGAKSVGELIPQAVSGAAAGAAGKATEEAGGNGYAQLAAALLAGHGAGRLAANRGLSPNELVAKGKLRRATEGLSGDDFRTAREAQAAAKAEGTSLLPSQAMPGAAPGLEELQGALLRSRASGADKFRTDVAQQPKEVQMLVEKLQKAGGQTPRSPDQIADSVQKFAETEAAAGPTAITEATKPLYNDPLGKAWTIKPEVVDRVGLGFDQAIHENRANPAVTGALTQARQIIVDAMSMGRPTPKIVAEAVQSVKTLLPAYSEYPQASNFVRKVVTNLVKPLEDMVAKQSPKLGQASEVQVELRGLLPSSFDATLRQASTTSGTEGAIAAIQKRPEVLRQLAESNPLLAQEIVQMQLDQAIAKATAVNSRTGVSPGNEGIALKKSLTEGDSGKAFNASLDLLFPGRPDAAAGFRRVLDVVANASKPRIAGGGGSGWNPSAAEEGVRLAGGSLGQKVGVVSRLTGGFFTNIRDNATIAVLSKPDAIERLAKISKMPQPSLTMPAIMAALPALFEEPKNGP